MCSLATSKLFEIEMTNFCGKSISLISVKLSFMSSLFKAFKD